MDTKGRRSPSLVGKHTRGSGGGSNIPPASSSAQWPNNIIIDLLENHEELYVADGNFSNFTRRMWRDIVEHVNAKNIESGMTFVYSMEQMKSKINSFKKCYCIV